MDRERGEGGIWSRAGAEEISVREGVKSVRKVARRESGGMEKRSRVGAGLEKEGRKESPPPGGEGAQKKGDELISLYVPGERRR